MMLRKDRYSLHYLYTRIPTVCLFLTKSKLFLRFPLGLCLHYVVVVAHAIPTVPSICPKEFQFCQICPLKLKIRFDCARLLEVRTYTARGKRPTRILEIHRGLSDS